MSDDTKADQGAHEPRGCPTPGACSAAAEIARLEAERERLHNLLRLVADEPNIDRARALADAELYEPNVRGDVPAANARCTKDAK